MIVQALVFGAVVGAAFPLGALLSKLNPFGHKGFSAVMGFGAGLLLAAVLTDLAPKAVEGLGLVGGAAMILLAALAYSLINLWIKQSGGEHRKRCGGCQAPPTEDEQPGSGKSIAIGTVMDAFPEALVLGVAIGSGSTPIALLAALFLGNAAQSMSATQGLCNTGRGPRFVWGLWFGLALAIILATLVATLLGADAPDAVKPGLMGVAAGVLIAMITEAMMPEAAEQPSPLLGVSAALGVAVFLALH